MIARCAVLGAISESETVRDIVSNLLVYKHSYEVCASQIDAIREWDKKSR